MSVTRHALSVIFLALFIQCESQAPEGIEASRNLRLADAKFRCCWINGRPYNYRSSHPVYGVDGANLQMFLFLKEMTGFQCTSFEEFNSTSNTGWEDYIQMTAQCARPDGLIRNSSYCRCDIASATLLPLPDRTIVDFFPTNFISEQAILTHMRNTKTTTNPWLFVNTFRPLVWMSIGIMALIFTFIKWFDEDFEPYSLQDPPQLNWTRYPVRALRYTMLKSPMCYRLRKAAQSAMMGLLGATPPQENRLPRHWLLNYTVCLFGLILVLTYESTMTSILVQEKTVGDYNTYADLLRCSFNISEVCVATGDYIDDVWDQIIEERERRDCEPYNRNSAQARFRNYDMLFEAVNSSECKYGLMDKGFALSQQHGRYCGNLVILGEPFGRSSSAMIAPKNWPYYDEMREVTLKIIESGVIAESVESFVHRKEKCAIQSDPTLTFDRLQNFFMVVGLVWLVLFIIVVFYPLHNAHVIRNFRTADKERYVDY